MTERIARIGLRIDAGPHADAAELNELAGQLRDELLELNIERAERTSAGQPPPGARAGEIFVAGALTVLLAQSSGLLTALVDLVRSWISRDSGRSVKLELAGDVLEVTGISQADQRELIKTWIDRNTDR
ncbi:MAG: effector-associated constant component EACC1 [Pseudonocardiaceae bacterium]